MIMITVPRMTEYTSTRVWEGPGVHLTQTFDILTQHLRVASAQCITQQLLPHCSLGAGGRLESGFIWSLPHNDTHNSKNLLTHTCIHTHHVVYSPVCYREFSMWLSLYGRVNFRKGSFLTFFIIPHVLAGKRRDLWGRLLPHSPQQRWAEWERCELLHQLSGIEWPWISVHTICVLPAITSSTSEP